MTTNKNTNKYGIAVGDIFASLMKYNDGNLSRDFFQVVELIGSNLSGSNSELEKATATVPLSTDDFAVLEAPQEENSSNQAVVAILISIGGLILAGIGVIIYLLIKNKKNKKSGDTNEKDKEDLQ